MTIEYLTTVFTWYFESERLQNFSVCRSTACFQAKGLGTPWTKPFKSWGVVGQTMVAWITL